MVSEDITKLGCAVVGHGLYLIAILASFFNSYMVLVLISAPAIMWIAFVITIVFMIVGGILVGLSK